MMTDDQGYGPVGRHGHPWIQTPNLDRMFDASLRFDRFLVSPTCSPTRAAMMSGRHPMKNGITHTILERERMALGTVTLPQVLKKAGYTTGIFGKWHLGDEEEYQPHNRGFDEAFIHGAGGIGQAYNCSCADAPGNNYFDPVIRHNGSFVKTDGYCTDLFFTAALGWIKQVKDKDAPFFAYITTNAPHGPFIAPPKNTKRFTDLGFGKGPGRAGGGAQPVATGRKFAGTVGRPIPIHPRSALEDGRESAPMSKVKPFHVLYKKQMKDGGIPDWVPPVLE
jgi:arylsulfatase A-like enzyme